MANNNFSSMPNLFDYATSELSQDAFLLWLLHWANPKCKEFDYRLYEVALTFVRMMLEKPDLDIASIECKKQESDIDVLAIITDLANQNKYALIIEDKTETREHDNQLQRYSNIVRKKYSYCTELHCVYYKSGNESLHSLNKLEEKYEDYIEDNFNDQIKFYFKKVLRKDIINVLKNEVYPPSSNTILTDYVDHLQAIEDLTQSFMSEPANAWSDNIYAWQKEPYAWQGFYLYLEKELGAGNWVTDFRNNCFKLLPLIPLDKEKNIQLYLCLEERNLCVRAKCKSKCQPEGGWSRIVKSLKEVMLGDLNLDNLIFDCKHIEEGNDVKIVEIKRWENFKQKMFIKKNFPLSAQPYISAQLKILQNRLSIAVDIINQDSTTIEDNAQ